MDAKRKKALQDAHNRRQYRILPATPTTASWDDVPDDVILDLVRSYTSAGDAVLFGKSQDLSVLAIRVYRGGHGYSVYARGVERLGEALERLERYRPARKHRAALAADYQPVAQVYSNLDLPYHPAFSPEQLKKQRETADARAREWNAKVDSISREFYTVASS